MNETQTTDTYVIDGVSFEPDLDTLTKRLHVKPGSPFVADLERLLDEAREIANPKACYKVALVENRGDDYVIVDGVKLTSRVLRVNLEHAHRVFAYVATCGKELDAWARAIDDMLFQYWGDAIKEMALRSATQALHRHLTDCFELGKTATMAPGSLADWPLPQQRPLFTIIGDVQDAIGVELSASFLMTPNKSVSGVRFPTEDDFASCQLCPRKDCPNRRAPYDVTLYERKYRQTNELEMRNEKLDRASSSQ